MPRVTLEFYGLSRHYAGCAQLDVEAETGTEAIRAAATVYPGLSHLLTTTGAVSSHYLLSLDGGRFLSDPNERLQDGSRLLVLSADAGG